MGVNDLDDEDGESVASRITELIMQIKNMYANIRIVVNEVTPRNDDRDEEVKKCNGALVNEGDDIFIAQQKNLRDSTYSFFLDNKHIKPTKIARYVSNIKRVLNRAYGRETPNTFGRFGTRNEPTRFQQQQINHQHPQNYDVRMRREMEERLRMELRRKLMSLID